MTSPWMGRSFPSIIMGCLEDLKFWNLNNKELTAPSTFPSQKHAKAGPRIKVTSDKAESEEDVLFFGETTTTVGSSQLRTTQRGDTTTLGLSHGGISLQPRKGPAPFLGSCPPRCLIGLICMHVAAALLSRSVSLASCK